jgi:hypothetical protein
MALSSLVRWRWASLRAAVIGYFVFFNVLAALPASGNPDPERLLRPFEQAELKRWARPFALLGLDVSPEQLARVYLSVTRGWAEVRAVALLPIEGWMSLTRTTQGWRLFGTPDEYQSALRVSVERAAEPGTAAEAVLYESGNPERRWNAARLEYRRIRAAYKPLRSGPPPTYDGLCQRLSEQLFAEQPDVMRVRVVLDRRKSVLPGEPPNAEHEEQFVCVVARPTP